MHIRFGSRPNPPKYSAGLLIVSTFQEAVLYRTYEASQARGEYKLHKALQIRAEL